MFVTTGRTVEQMEVERKREQRRCVIKKQEIQNFKKRKSYCRGKVQREKIKKKTLT